MLFSIITPNCNSGKFLEQTLRSVISQADDGIELEYIVVDGGSTDNSHEIIKKYSQRLARTIIEPDSGPANAINKGLAAANGEVLAWLNADDLYYPGALRRVRLALQCRPEAAICFGGCPIIDAQGQEIRAGITRFKEFFYPLSSRFTFQCINYLSQPALFFRRSAFAQAGPLREDMIAAWDYEFLLRLWRSGDAVQVPGAPLAAFRWHEQSISGQRFTAQFREEYEAARADAGRFSPQTAVHFFVRWGIVGIYSLMASRRRRSCA
jgi:glycosyltransferase involved in cell wall biosynthesis